MRYVLLAAIAAVAALPLSAQQADFIPEKVEGPAFKIFQFPHDRIPRIDADLSDWDIVPDSYVVSIDDMWDDSGKHEGLDKSSIDIKVKVGWVKGLNRLYFCYEAYDDYWEFGSPGLRNDTFEVVVDGDLSGGPHVYDFRSNPNQSETEAYFTFQNIHAQNYHIFTPAAFGKSWCMAWGPQQWLKYFPWSDIAYSYDFKPGEGGVLKMEFFITPFDEAYSAETAHEDNTGAPYGSVVSPLYEGKQIGLCWAVIDYDGGKQNNGFWNLSKYHKMYGNASMERLFELQPLEESLLSPEAAWSHFLVPGTRTVRFTDESVGKYDSWHWDFGDGCTSDERNPVHTYKRDGSHYTVTLTVDGPDGRRECSKVWEVSVWGGAKTASSLFWRRDSLQIPEIVSKEAVQYGNVGHHGPAVENAGFALRLYFNDSGAVDIYSKSGEQMELLKYLWYPTEAQMRDEGAGCDEYLVGKTVGVGGYSLWDGKKDVKLVATKGRTARAGKTEKGSYAEIISYGVICGRKSYDISVRVDVFDGDRSAVITATELNGRKVRFLTGVNHQPGADIRLGDGWASVWGVHPSDVSKNPIPLGAGIIYDSALFSETEKTQDMIRLLSKPAVTVSTRVVAASTKEKGINDALLFESFVRDLSALVNRGIAEGEVGK